MGKIMSTIVALVPRTMVEYVWDECTPFLEMVLAKAPEDIGLDKVYNRCLSGDTMLVIITDGSEIIAVNTLEVRELDSGNKILFLPIIGGSRTEEWQDRFIDLAHEIARHHDCIELRGMAVRKAWLRKLSRYGFEEHFVTLKCKVKE